MVVRRRAFRRDGKHVMRFKSPLQVGRVSLADDLQRCLAWSTALAAPQPATSVTLLLSFFEAGRGTIAQRVLDDAGVTTHDLEPLEMAARARQPTAKGLKRLARRVPGLTHSAEIERALRRASNQMLLEKRNVLTSDDVFLALLMEDGTAKDALVSLGKDPSAMRSEVMRPRPATE
jgi:Clp amino terminal domain, pathogenicity island component